MHWHLNQYEIILKPNQSKLRAQLYEMDAVITETLKNNGLEEIKSVGESFDPNFHEALMQREEEIKVYHSSLTILYSHMVTH